MTQLLFPVPTGCRDRTSENGTALLGLPCPPISQHIELCRARVPALTFSNSPMGAGQVVGSWHTHIGVLLSSSSHTLPCLQW